MTLLMSVGVVTLILGFVSQVQSQRVDGHWRIESYAGTGMPGYSGDGGPASQAQLDNPYGLARGPDGALYVCDMNNHVIRKISRDGIISTVAGTGKRGYSGDGGPATLARLNEPYEVRFDKQQNLLFVERLNHVVRRVDAKGQTITTVAGSGTKGFSGDGGPARRAQLNEPHSLQLDSSGNIYICDIGNHRIRKVDAQTGNISTFAGTGQQGPTAEGAKIEGTPLNGPRTLDFDEDGNLWLALREGNAVYQLDLKTKTIHHVAGTGEQGFTGNGGSAGQATLSGPKGLSVGAGRYIYLADTESHTIRRIDLSRKIIELVAGTGQRGSGPDGDPFVCRLSRPHGVFVDSDGSIFVGDSEAHVVRMIRQVE
jgi:streptogramin lyase